MTRLSKLLAPNEGNGGSGAPAPFPAPKTSGQDMAKKQLRILIVDDEHVLAKSQARILNGAGHDCKIASNVSDALEIIRQCGIEVVLTDNDMENRNDGVRLIKQLREEAPQVKTILMSGGIREETWDLLAAESITGVLEKPVSRETLIGTMAKLASE